jgi:hypothetical protein
VLVGLGNRREPADVAEQDRHSALFAALAPLVERSRYAIAEGCTAVVSEQVLLRPRATVPLAMTRRVYV